MNKITANDLLDCLRQGADRMYSGEPVTQLQHAWQCAHLARKSGATPALQLASWLHDIGHLLVAWPGTPTLLGQDDRHEVVAAAVLLPLWGAAVAEPVRLHVQAKRYLVTRQPSYRNKLSEDSIRSLRLQGDLLSEDECREFEASPYHRDALMLRIWDDLGKKPGWFAANRTDALAELHALMADVPVIENSPQ